MRGRLMTILISLLYSRTTVRICTTRILNITSLIRSDESKSSDNDSTRGASLGEWTYYVKFTNLPGMSSTLERRITFSVMREYKFIHYLDRYAITAELSVIRIVLRQGHSYTDELKDDGRGYDGSRRDSHMITGGEVIGRTHHMDCVLTVDTTWGLYGGCRVMLGSWGCWLFGGGQVSLLGWVGDMEMMHGWEWCTGIFGVSGEGGLVGDEG
ncbi:hypothetical protein Tco_1110517 [Tanacetum coccineum]|uniref:Uncharacterized protein n=1 Tax=Tanacetum coccineum TaxID=301880 RepID=A0ABQ5ILJ1_9ASTR